MQIHNLKQGTPEWHAYRAAHFNASDAPAMMGCSPYKSRNELLHERHTGTAPEVDAGTQALFDDGHRFEALARGRAEQLVGGRPVPGDRLARRVVGFVRRHHDGRRRRVGAQDPERGDPRLPRGRAAGPALPRADGAAAAGLRRREAACSWPRSGTTTTTWSKSGTSGTRRTKRCAPRSSPAGRSSKPTWPATSRRNFAPKPQAEPIMQLPALAIQIRGEVAHSNLPVFKAKAEAFIASIKTDLLTDEDFANAEATIKFCDRPRRAWSRRRRPRSRRPPTSMS
jgi:hypothetical protein